MRDYVTFEHRHGRYPMGHRQVNDGIPVRIASFHVMEETKGDRIKRLREARGLTQPALARLLISMGAPSTLTKAAIAKWENGDTADMKNDTFILLADALGTDVKYLAWGQARTPPEAPRPAPAAVKRKA